MSLNYIHDKLEDIPTEYQGLYSERGGKYVLTGIAGIKTQADVDAMARARDHEKNTANGYRARLDKVHFKGKSFAEMGDDEFGKAVEALDKYDELEASAGKVDDEKINQIVESRVKTKVAPIERERDTLRNQLGESTKKNEDYATRERNRQIRDAARKAAIEFKGGKILTAAMDDMESLAERMFDVGEDGSTTVRPDNGFTPGLSPAEFMVELAQKRPHWFEGSEGGGAKGGKAGTNPNGKKTITRAQWQQMTPTDSTRFFEEGGKVVD